MIATKPFRSKLTKTKDLFIPFIMAGDPSPELTIDLAVNLQQAGADILELGVPYSDPLADGPTIQDAANRALQHKMTLRKAIELVPEMRKKGVSIPVVIFTYYNPVLQVGEDAFFNHMKENDVDGLLIPDLPFEESEQMRDRCNKEGIEFISLVAPNSEDRVQKIAENANGFLYCVSSLGVTGTRKELNTDISSFLEHVKLHSKVPVAVGFGVSTYEQVKMLQQHCDGVIIGSAIINLIAAQQDALLNQETRQQALQAFKNNIMKMIGK
ncbi:tryptophan synthase subunit alpha [Bacillus sp. SCS-151]|uniref:tryptophan synthase subunit alpha n=1 Tax=Nanhaiella sioensis TaxID=3115293 RepID=UPI00397AA31D